MDIWDVRESPACMCLPPFKLFHFVSRPLQLTELWYGDTDIVERLSQLAGNSERPLRDLYIELCCLLIPTCTPTMLPYLPTLFRHLVEVGLSNSALKFVFLEVSPGGSVVTRE